MEDKDQILPDIFYTLLDQREKADSLTEVIIGEYCCILKNQESFFCDLKDVLGTDALIELVKNFGGITLEIPKASDILSTVRRNNDTTD